MTSGILTALLIVIFVGIAIWAYSGRQKRRFKEAEQLALDPEDREIQVEDMEKRK